MDLESVNSNSTSKKNGKGNYVPASARFTLDVKAEVLQFLESGGTQHAAAEKYGVPVDTILEINEMKDQIYAMRDRMIEMQLASTNIDKNVLALDEPLVQWINSVKQYGLKIIGRDIQAQANQLAMDQGLVGFSATQGWLTKFRQRNFRLFRSDPTALKDPDEDLGSSDADEQAVRMAQLKQGKPRIRLNISQKMDVIKYVTGGKNLTQTREFFGLPTSSICTIMKNRAKTEEAFAKKQHDRCLLRTEKAARLDEPLVKWIHDMRAYEIKLVGDDIRARALELAAEIGLTNFSASSGWLGRFRWRNRAALAADAGFLDEEQPPSMEDRIVDENHVPDWVKEIHRKNEKRRMSFPVQASAPHLPILGTPLDDGEDDNALSDEDNSRDVDGDFDGPAPLSSSSSSPPKQSAQTPYQQKRPSGARQNATPQSSKQQQRRQRLSSSSQSQPAQSSTPRRTRQQHSPQKRRERDRDPSPPPQPPPHRFLPPNLTTRSKRISPVEDLEKSLIALEMDHIRRFSNLLRHHKLLLVVDDGEECRMSGDPGLQGELFGEDDAGDTSKSAQVKVEVPFDGEDGAEEDATFTPSSESSRGGTKRKSGGGKGAPASKKKKREESEKRSKKDLKDATTTRSADDVYPVSEGVHVEVAAYDAEEDGDGEVLHEGDADEDGVGEMYGGSHPNGDDSPAHPSSSSNYDAGSVFPPRPSDDHHHDAQSAPDSGRHTDGISKHSMAAATSLIHEFGDGDGEDSDSIISASVNGNTT